MLFASVGVVCEQYSYQVGSCMKVGGLQRSQSLRQIQKIAASCFRKNTKCPNHRKFAIRGFASAVQIINN